LPQATIHIEIDRIPLRFVDQYVVVDEFGPVESRK